MPSLPAATLTKIADLRTASNNWTEVVEVHQIIEIQWSGGSKYYSSTRPDLTTTACPVSPIEAILITDEDAPFLPVVGEGSMGDQELSIQMWDGDGSFADLVEAGGEGQQCIVNLWFPSEALLLPVFWGHLRLDDNSHEYVWSGRIANGFRSPDLPLPSRTRTSECQAVFGGSLLTQAEIDEGGCPYNIHIGGGTIGTPTFTTCPRLTTADCTTRGVPTTYHYSYAFEGVSVRNNQTKGPNLLSRSKGNDTGRDEAVRVVMGTRRVYDMEVIAFRRDYNNNDPEKGFFWAMYEAGEGPIRAIRNPVVKDQDAQRENGIRYAYRLGTAGQSAYTGLSSHGYSHTAWFSFGYGWIDPGTVGPGDFAAHALIEGLTDIRVYSDSTTYLSQYSDRRVWQVARMLTSKRWGFGLDYSRLDIDSLLECATWGDYVKFTDDNSNVWIYDRGASHVELNERSTQQQIEDMCLAGRLSRPFLFEGKLHIIPLEPLTAGELTSAPDFTDNDEPGARKIIFEPTSVKGVEVELSTLRRSQMSDDELPNRIEGTYSDAFADYVSRPAPPVEDVTAQFAAGRVQGDFTRRKVTKKYSYLGVTDKHQAVALGHHILWFGPFEEGGTKNNLEIRFRCWFLDALDLHEYKVIHVHSDQLTRYGFEYFRVKRIEYRSDLQVEITAQAYNATELDAFEVSTPGPSTPGDTVNISGASNTYPVVITTATEHGIPSGAYVVISGVGGMTEINDRIFQVLVQSATTFTLYNIAFGPGDPEFTPVDGTGYGTYTSGGVVTVTNPQPYSEPALTYSSSYSNGVLKIEV